MDIGARNVADIKRYSDDFLFNPYGQFNWENRENYSVIYPEKFILQILKDLKLAETDYEILRFSMINAAMNYELSKQQVLIRQKPFHEELKAMHYFAKKAADFRESFNKARNTGLAFFSILLDREQKDFCIGKHPKAVAMFRNFIEPAKVCPDALVDFLTILEEMTLHTAPRLKQNNRKTKISHVYSSWVNNLSEALNLSPYCITQGAYAGDGLYSSPVITILSKIMKPLDPAVTEAQLAQAIKDFRRTAKAEGRLVKSRKKS
jgi:hypothetical protein